MEKKYKVTLGVLISILIVLVIMLIAWEGFVRPNASQMMVNQLAESAGLSQEEIEEITNNLSESEKEEVDNIVSKYSSDPGIVTKAAGFVARKDVSGLKDYAKSVLSESEKERVKAIYEEHKAELDSFSY